MTINPSLILGYALRIACACLPAVSQCGEIPSQGPMTFSAFDRNEDGSVTEDEYNAARAERIAARAAQGAPMRGAANAPTFADFDQNGDGRMTPDEFTATRQAHTQGRPGQAPGGGMAPGMGRGPGDNMPTFIELDLNADGTLTEEELYNARAQRMRARAQQGYPMRNAASAPTFEQIDTNGDQVVTPDELAAAQSQHRRQPMQ